LLSLAFRIPPLLNARSTNSDAAIVGLQAMHILRGEWSALLWGSGYQTSADSFIAAAIFAIAGASPTALMLSALSLHIASTYLVFCTLCDLFRHSKYRLRTSFLLTLPIILSPSSIHSYALYPPRQLSLTLAIVAFFSVHRSRNGASPERRALWLSLGGLASGLSVSADPYALVLLPSLAIYAALSTWRQCRTRRALAAFTSAVTASAAVGLLPFWAIHRMTSAKSGPMGFSTAMLAHHWRLLVDECLPWALSYKVYFARHVMDYAPWDAPVWFQIISVAGALLVAAIVITGLVSPGIKQLPSDIRDFGFSAALIFPVAISAFVVSVMAMDHFSMRYLAVLTLLTPWAAAPAAALMKSPQFTRIFAPHVIASAVSGWVGYGPFVDGLRPVTETPELRDDYTLFSKLAARSIRYATADYWTAYRLTFLSGESLIVVPTNPREDRYAPYREAFGQQKDVAYIFDPHRSREDLRAVEQTLRRDFAWVEKDMAGGLTVFYLSRVRNLRPR